MKPIFIILIFTLLQACNSSNDTSITKTPTDTSKTNYASDLPDESFTISPANILKDYNTWYNYTYFNVRLSQDFIGLNIDSAEIDKTSFLQQLMTEKVVAFKIKLLRGKPVYKLYRNNNSNESIQSTIQQLASIEMGHFKMEGTQIPNFNFVDLNGGTYSSSTTKGKIIVLKCWFIRCTACIQEFPECNELVDEYEGKKDILFLSLAIDPKKDLQKFLTDKKLKYAVIPETGDYMTNQLNIAAYPTHLLIDRTGKIIKVVSTIEELKPFLKKEIEKS
jgi:peroxiredoxin